MTLAHATQKLHESLGQAANEREIMPLLGRRREYVDALREIDADLDCPPENISISDTQQWTWFREGCMRRRAEFLARIYEIDAKLAELGAFIDTKDAA